MLLRAAFLFQDASDATLEAVAGIAVEERHAAGTFLFRADDPATDLYILAEGRVRLSVIRGGALAHTVNQPRRGHGMVQHGRHRGLHRVRRVHFARHRDPHPQPAAAAHSGSDPASGFKFFRRLATHIGGRLVESYGATLSMQGHKGTGSYG